MIARTFFRYSLVAITMMAASSCADRAPTNVEVAKLGESQLLGLPILVSSLNRTSPLASDVSSSAVIGTGGGSISIPAAGFRLDVPAGAVSSPLTITATAVAGKVVAYDFEPAGSKFAKGLTITQKLAGTDWYARGYLTAKGGYYKDASLINEVLGLVQVVEILPATVDLLNGQVSFKVTHFSGYMVSGG